MSRPLRIEYPDAWYHVMNRGRRGEDIFTGKEDNEIFIALLREAVDLWSVRISAYCLMKNHYHILLQTPLGNLSRFMRHLNGVYTQRFNRLHGYDGSLFRGRFKSILVEEDSHLLELVRYIHRNSLRAGMVDSLTDYPWSSHHGYLSRKKEWSWLNKEIILSMLVEKRSRKKAYLQFMGMDDSEELGRIFAKKNLPSMLGSETFISRVKEKFFEEKKHLQVPDSVELAPEIEQIKRAVCRRYAVEEESLLTAQRGKSNEPRNVAIYLCRILRNDTLIAIGQVFGMSGYSPAGSAIERVKKRLAADKKFQEKIDEITHSMIFRDKRANIYRGEQERFNECS